ncbi:MAG TPA: AbfB domain-containing protein [Kineosporiaceae bacterium]
MLLALALALTSLLGALLVRLGTAPTPPPTPIPTRTLTVRVDKAAASTNATQWGHLVEDINHSVEGGLNANIIRNSTLKDGAANPPPSWSLVTAGTGRGSLTEDTRTPLSAANPSALKLTIRTNGGTHSVGVANSGFDGVAIKPSSTYTASFFARSGGGFTGAVEVRLESLSGTSYAHATTSALTSTWTRYTLTLATPASTPSGTSNRVVFYPDGNGTGDVLLDVVRVLPPTYRSTGLLRTDLMTKLAATRPGFWRIPGGNYLEGKTLATRFAWKNTIGPVENRPGHQNDAWGYWSTDQAGLKAYLDMAESSGAEPLLAVFAGYVLNGTVVAQADLASYVQDALDEIEYVTGTPSTTWGARRAADGHRDPYPLHYVEIGNEDLLDGSGSYSAYRFPMFYDAIKAKYPDLKIIASASVTSRAPDVIDDHYYSDNPATLTGMAHQYDRTDRNGPKHLVGEYAATNGTAGNPTGTLAGALGEAGFMTGLLRNADVVVGASYAPALSRVSSFQWPTNLIAFDAAQSYGSPSYYVQQMFGANKGTYVVPTSFSGVGGLVSHVATRAANGTVYVHVVNPTSDAVRATVDVAGAATIERTGTATVLTGDPAARNTLAAPTAVAPKTSTFAASPRTTFTFPANSLTLLTFTVTGPVTPYLATDRGTALRVTSPGAATGRSVSGSPGVGATAVVSANSSAADRKSATFFVRTGLSDANCYSFESRANAGQYLRATAADEVVLAAPDASASFAADATFCATAGHSGTGVSFASASHSHRYLRHYQNVLYVAADGGSAAHDSATDWAADTTFTVSSGWWHSDVDVAMGRHSFQATTAGYRAHSLRHSRFLARIAQITASSPSTDLQDATFTIVPGLADSSCYSFVSVNYPNRYLRHYSYRLRLDVKDSSALFAADSTFCAQPGNGGTGTSWQSYNFPNRYWRHYNEEVWVAGTGGGLAADTTTNWAEDTSWTTIAPWAG